MASRGSQGGLEANTKKNRPENTAFRQQRLPAWKPVVTARSTLPSFLVLGAIFMIFGGILFGSTQSGKELQIDYTYCNSSQSSIVGWSDNCATMRENSSYFGEACQCELTFTLDEDWHGEVFLYYKLTNYYQNHRRYIRSRSDIQLRGDVSDTTECSPLEKRSNGNDTLPIAPCGLIANSLFNDSFKIFNSTNDPVTLTATGIAWKSDKETKFRNPSGSLPQAFKDTIQPPNWQKPAYNLSVHSNNNGFQNEDLIVWMRTAALPTFRKLHRRILNGLKKGTYTVRVHYNYPTSMFDGHKYIVLTTISWMGGKNPFLGIAYLTVGSICVAACGTLLLVDKYRHRGFFAPAATL